MLAGEAPKAESRMPSGLLAALFLLAAVVAGAVAFLLLTEAGQGLTAPLSLIEGVAP